MEDGSIVCRITGICVRTCSYGLEYELQSRQGFRPSEHVSGAGQQLQHHHQQQQQQTTSLHTSSACESSSPAKKRQRQGREEGAAGGGRGGGASIDAILQNIKQIQQPSSSQRKGHNESGMYGTGVFRIRVSVMKNDFHEEKLCFWLKKLISAVTQNQSILYTRCVARAYYPLPLLLLLLASSRL